MASLAEALQHQFEGVQAKRVGILGDMCLDVNSIGKYSGISRELEGLAIFRIEEARYCPGGGGNLAMNFAKLHVPVILFGTWGPRMMRLGQYCDAGQVDWNRVVLEQHFRAFPSISVAGMVVGPRTPVFGKYFLLLGHHLHRFDLVSEDMSPVIEEIVCLRMWDLKDRIDCLLIADYDETRKGVVTPRTVQAAKNLGLPIFGTSRERIVFLEGIDWLVINELEMNLALGLLTTEYKLDPVEERMRGLIELFNLNGLVVTLGEKGIAIATTKEAFRVTRIYSQRLEGQIDPCGAGDTFLAIFAMSILAEYTPEEAGRLGIAGARVVAKKLFGTGYPSYKEIEEEYNYLFGGEKNE